VACAALVCAGSTCVVPARAQERQTGKVGAPNAAEAVPIECWWRTSRASVRVAEPFSVVLTCAVLDIDTVKVVPDEARLSAAALQVAPFEIVAGRRGPDLRTRDRRFFQYEYQLRLLADDRFGRDVKLPETAIAYRIESRTRAGGALEGRELAYTLPPLTVRVLSLVPADAADIREASPGTFSEIDQRSFRASMLLVSSGTLLALGTIVGFSALVRAAARSRRTAAGPAHLLSETAILRGVARELRAVGRERERVGWTSELVTRALAALRVAAACAASRPVTQIRANSGPVDDGALVIEQGRFVSERVRVSATVTAATLAPEDSRVRNASTVEAGRNRGIEALADALARLTRVQYQDGTADASDLDAAMRSAAGALARLKRESQWKAVKHAALGWRTVGPVGSAT
jgi:hypothetical protein